MSSSSRIRSIRSRNRSLSRSERTSVQAWSFWAISYEREERHALALPTAIRQATLLTKSDLAADGALAGSVSRGIVLGVSLDQGVSGWRARIRTWNPLIQSQAEALSRTPFERADSTAGSSRTTRIQRLGGTGSGTGHGWVRAAGWVGRRHHGVARHAGSAAERYGDLQIRQTERPPDGRDFVALRVRRRTVDDVMGRPAIHEAPPTDPPHECSSSIPQNARNAQNVAGVATASSGRPAPDVSRVQSGSFSRMCGNPDV